MRQRSEPKNLRICDWQTLKKSLHDLCDLCQRTMQTVILERLWKYKFSAFHHSYFSIIHHQRKQCYFAPFACQGDLSPFPLDTYLILSVSAPPIFSSPSSFSKAISSQRLYSVQQLLLTPIHTHRKKIIFFFVYKYRGIYRRSCMKSNDDFPATALFWKLSRNVSVIPRIQTYYCCKHLIL